MYIQQQDNSVFIGADDRKFHFQQTPVLEENMITEKHTLTHTIKHLS